MRPLAAATVGWWAWLLGAMLGAPTWAPHGLVAVGAAEAGEPTSLMAAFRCVSSQGYMRATRHHVRTRLDHGHGHATATATTTFKTTNARPIHTTTTPRPPPRTAPQERPPP